MPSEITKSKNVLISSDSYEFSRFERYSFCLLNLTSNVNLTLGVKYPNPVMNFDLLDCCPATFRDIKVI